MAAVDNSNLAQFRLDPAMIGWLQDRAARTASGSVSEQARAEIGLWRAVLAGELRRIRLTVAQLSCVADVLGGVSMSPAVAVSAGLVYAECYDAFCLAGEGSYGAKWGIGEAALLGYLGALSPAADHALADAISRWWQRGLDATGEGFAAVGLRASDVAV